MHNPSAWVVISGMKIKLYIPEIPETLTAMLSNRQLRYTSPLTLFHLVWLDGQNYCGVFGDGENGAYEWFVFSGGILETSDCGYGDDSIALRESLNAAVPA